MQFIGDSTLSAKGWFSPYLTDAGWFDQELTADLPPITGTLSQTLGALTATAQGQLAITGSATPTLGALASSAAAGLAIVGTLSATLGALTLTATNIVPTTDPNARRTRNVPVSNRKLLPLPGHRRNRVAGLISRTRL
jgi:hypothetical protein